jgi:glutaredoxin-like protein NrdH
MPAPMPHGVTFHYHPTDDTVPTHMVPSYGPRWAPDTLVEDTMFDAPAVEARHNGKHVGYLEWSMKDRPGHVVNFPGEIANVHVEEPYRRHGIADAMLDFARQHEPRVNHSDRLTDLGSMWRDHNQNKEAKYMTAAVTVYTQPNCAQCFTTKKHLDKLGIEHQTVDVTQDPEAHAFVTGLGYTSAPVVVAGEDHWSGYRPDRLKGLISE